MSSSGLWHNPGQVLESPFSDSIWTDLRFKFVANFNVVGISWYKPNLDILAPDADCVTVSADPLLG